jgi:hypothetical protein
VRLGGRSLLEATIEGLTADSPGPEQPHSKLSRRQWLLRLLMFVSLTFALLPFLGVTSGSFYVGDVQLSVLNLERWVPQDLISPLRQVSGTPAHLIANIIPIKDVTVFRGEGVLTPKPIITVAFWGLLALVLFLWSRWRRSSPN